jgi:flagellar capping protein FliD
MKDSLGVFGNKLEEFVDKYNNYIHILHSV